MSILVTYSILFLLSSFIGVGFLSWFQKFYLQGQPEQYLSAVPVTALITLILCAVIILIMSKVLYPVDKIFKKAKNSMGEGITQQEKNFVIKVKKKMNMITIISTVIAFVLGNLSTIIIQIMRGKIPFELSRIIFAIIHSAGFGGIATLYTIHIMDLFYGKKMKLLKIHHLENTKLSGTMSFNLSYMFITATIAMTSTVAMVPYQLIYTGNTNLFGNGMSFYILNILLVFAITFTCVLIPFILVLKGLSERIRKNSNALNEIAKSGNLVDRLDIRVNDDLGVLTDSINKVMDKLSVMISDIKTESENVHSASNHLSEATDSSVAALTQMQSSLDKINANGNKQHNIITEISQEIDNLEKDSENLTAYMASQSDSMRQNSQSIAEMAENIKKVAQMSMQADTLTTSLAQTSERGTSLVKSSITSISDIQKASVEVQKIIKVIQSIASQTNLLSMNASIEAAHAGEFGAGFSVVANEVRSLAASSAKSAKDIQEHIKDMVAKIEVGVSTSKQAGEAFEQIAQSVKENQRIMQQLSTAMEEQRIGAEENMRVTNDVSESLVEANTLAKKQNEFAIKVKETMDNIVVITDDISQSIDEGLKATENMRESVYKMGNSVNTNRNAVETMEKHVALFKV